MGDSFAQKSTTNQNSPVHVRVGDQHDVNTRSQNDGRVHEMQKDQKTKGHDDHGKQDVLQVLRGKLDRGEHLQDSEQLLFQALAKELANKAHTGAQEQPHPSEEQPHPSIEQPQQQSHQFQKEPQQQPQWFEKAKAADNSLLSQETQNLIKRMGGNIPAPPFMNDDFNQQEQQHNGATTAHNGATTAKPQDAGDDQNTFEQDQRDEERRLYEMFQGDTHHVKGDRYEGDGKLFDKEDVEYGDKNEDDYDEKDGQDDGGNADKNNYNEKDEDYMYGDQKNQVKPAEQGANALI